MRINVCVNGTFRYPDYIRHYAEAGVLGRFFYAHRRSTDPASLGLTDALGRNVWLKEYALHAACRGLPGPLAARLEQPIFDLWQAATMRSWVACDAVEAVIGGVADRVLAFARRRGARTVGHPVCSHPEAVAAHVGRAYAGLGLDPAEAAPRGTERRRAEIALCDTLLVDSAFVGDSFRAAGYPANRIVRIRPGIDLVRFRARDPAERDRRTFRVVCVGAITPRKAQHLLLRAWRALRLPRAELVLVGLPGPRAEAVLRGHDGGFVHRPRLPQAAIRDLLVGASAFVLPSVEDGFGQAAYEAMACGVPVIVSDHVGMADAIRPGVDGFVVPAFGWEEIAMHLEALYRDSSLADAVGTEAGAAVRARGGWPAYAAEVLAIHARLHAGVQAAAEAA